MQTDVTLIREDHPPIVVVEHAPGASAESLQEALIEFGTHEMPDACENLFSTGCRCVGLDRLSVVMQQGIDVEPSTGVIWVNWLSKALEYGGDERILLVYDPEKLQRTFREVAADLDASEVARLAAEYPTRHRSSDGSTIWLSRLPESDKRRCSVYEAEYARWIPTDPMSALDIIVVLGPHGSRLPERVRLEIAGERDDSTTTA